MEIAYKPPAAAYMFNKERQFAYEGVTSDVVTYQEPNDTRHFVEALDDGQVVTITYLDGSRAHLVYSVDPITAFDLMKATGYSAVNELMHTAESDIRRLV